ncbi:Capsular glucan synthase [Aquisphaera giovannonii]|uniref:Capsular glucan synthase n=1 Tax=Aquisphaera giovannonii TaxID=406548 RepID=A0A5B9W688_9BACT|nr:glycosyltransferase [Aquisphaera giovannonii]QEH35847.1 Capsular glucan synthase [Aquisphaera giovannonii]
MQALEDRLRAASPRPRPSRPVRVALVITDLDVGGAERALVGLATRLDRARWEPSVIALGGEGALAAELGRAGIDCQCLGGGPRRPLAIVSRLARALRTRGPELVQSFLFHANLAARLAAPLAGRPWVLGGLRVAEREKGWHLTLDRITERLAAGSVCVSEGVRRFSLEAGRLDPRRLAVIPNGIDPRPYDEATPVPRSELGIPRDAFLAVQVGRLAAQKGLVPLLDAAERVIAGCPGWHLALAGDGPDRGWLLDRIAGSEALRDRVHWLGPRRDVPGLLATADLLVLASLWEGMPNAVLEAMAASRAVVATAVEGTDELVVPAETGWLVPPGDATALAAALREAALNPSACRSFGLAGRARVERRHSAGGVVAAYDSLWSAILGYRD